MRLRERASRTKINRTYAKAFARLRGPTNTKEMPSRQDDEFPPSLKSLIPKKNDAQMLPDDRVAGTDGVAASSASVSAVPAQEMRNGGCNSDGWLETDVDLYDLM